MRKHARTLALAATLAALALAVGGCGGGDDESSDGATTAAAAETAEPATTEEEAEETTTAATGIADEDCIELASIGAKFSEALGSTGQNADFEATTKFFDELADKAPDEIKNDLQVLAAAWTEVATALKDIDLSNAAAASPETLAKLQELSNKFNTPELQQASKNLTAWSNEHCGTGTTTTP